MLKFDTYETGGFYDEMFLADGRPRSGARLLEQRIKSLSNRELLQRQQAAERALLHMGITPRDAAPITGSFRGTGVSSHLHTGIQVRVSG